MQEKEISKDLVFDCKLYRVWKAKVELEDGTIADREYLEHKAGSVGAVVLDSSQNIFLVKEYRAAVKEEQLHIPGGAFDLEKETPEEAIIRELQEEIGKKPNHVEKLFEFHGGGSWIWPQHIFFCTDLEDDPLARDIDERIEVVKIPFQSYLERLLDNEPSRFGDFKAVIMVAQKLGLIELKS